MKPQPRANLTPLVTERKLVDLAEPALLGSFIALLFSSTLLPSDSVPSLGLFVSQTSIWLSLALATFAFFALTNDQRSRLESVDLLGLGYLAWTFASAINVRGRGDLRGATNSFWQQTALVLAFIIGRRLIRSRESRRNTMILLICLGVGLSLDGLEQYAIEFPAHRAEAEARRDELLRENNVDPASPEADVFMNRLFSKEPLATYALTNTFAGLLSIVALLLLSLQTGLYRSKHRSAFFSCAAALAIVVTCLLLTKSRTALIATAFGSVAIVSLQWQATRKLPWRGILISLAVLIGLGVIAFLWGGLDRQVFSEAPTSVLYRLQYWISSVAMIGDHWLFGCGPGNFQSVYPKYKLPEASEVIGDPHNFVLEIAATIGVPGVILIGLWLVWIMRGSELTRNQSPTEPISAQPSSIQWWMLGGALVSAIVTPLFGALYGYGGIGFLGIPIVSWTVSIALLLFVILRNSSLCDAPSPIVVRVIVLVCFGNLLAAGGIGFPNLFITIATLLAFTAPFENRTSIDGRNPTFARIIPAMGCLALWVAFEFSTARPVRAGALAYDEAEFLATESVAKSLALFDDACAADPWNFDYAMRKASLEFQAFVAQPTATGYVQLMADIDRAIARNPRSFAGYRLGGEASLVAAELLEDSGIRSKAITYYQSVVERYPAWSLPRAELAIAFESNGQSTSAIAEAKEALRLDSLCPHLDKKLVRYQSPADKHKLGSKGSDLEKMMRRLGSSRPIE